MPPPLPPHSYRTAAFRHSHVASRRIVAGAIYKSISASRSFCWWRKRRIRPESYRVSTHGCVRNEPDLWLRVSKSEPPFRSYGGDKHDNNERWRRKVAIWKRMIEKDPYNAIFGASNSALRGKGWQNPMWRSVAEWDKALKDVCSSLDRAFEEPGPDKASAKASPTTPIRPSPGTQPSALERDGDRQQAASRPSISETDSEEPIAAYTYDPVSGKMVPKHGSENDTATQPDNGHAEPQRSKGGRRSDHHVQTRSTTESASSLDPQMVQKSDDARPPISNQTGLYSNLKNLPDSNVDDYPTREESYLSYKSKLSKLPENDVDLIELEDLRARIGFLRSRVDKLSNTTNNDRTYLEQDFDQLHSQTPSEIVHKPNTRYTPQNPQRAESAALQNQVPDGEVKNKPLYDNSKLGTSAGLQRKPITRLPTALERMEGQPSIAPSTEGPQTTSISKYADRELVETLAEAESEGESLEELADEIIAMERALETRIGDLLVDIVCRRRFDPSKEFSQLQDEREAMLMRINALQRVTWERLQFGHISPEWANNIDLYYEGTPELKHTGAYRAIDKIIHTRVESELVIRDLLKILDRYASSLKSPHFDFANAEEKYPGTSPRKDNYRGLESYDIQDMAQLVSFPESEGAGKALQATEGLVTEFAINLDKQISAGLGRHKSAASWSSHAVAKEETAYETAPKATKESPEFDESSLSNRYDTSRVQNVPLRKTLGKNFTADVGRGSVAFLNQFKDYERETRGTSDPTIEELNKAMNAERAVFNAKITGASGHASPTTTAPLEQTQEHSQAQEKVMGVFRDTAQASPETTSNDLLGTHNPTRVEPRLENEAVRQSNEPAEIDRYLYMMYTYDPEAKEVIRETISTREQPEPNEKPLNLHQIMKRLEHPARFIHELKTFSPQGPWQVIAAYPNTLITRVAVPRNYEQGGVHGKPLQEHFPLTQRQEQRTMKRDGQEEKGTHAEGSHGHEGKRRMGTLGRVLSAGIWGATVCYVAGVVGELLK